MNRHFQILRYFPKAHDCIPRGRRSPVFVLGVFLIGGNLCFGSAAAHAQSEPSAKPGPSSAAPANRQVDKTSPKRGPNAAEQELQRRLDAAHAAQRSGEPSAVASANKQLIAIALREIGQLRLLESLLVLSRVEEKRARQKSMGMACIPNRIYFGVASIYC